MNCEVKLNRRAITPVAVMTRHFLPMLLLLEGSSEEADVSHWRKDLDLRLLQATNESMGSVYRVDSVQNSNSHKTWTLQTGWWG